MKIKLLAFMFLFVFIGCDPEENSDISITDIDGNSYPTVTIGSQAWTAKNLNVSHYRNGDPIPEVQNPDDWANLTTGAFCYYSNITANGIQYGKLYNWYAINDPRGLAPEGWHIPTENEWNTLINYLGGNQVAGGKLKSTDSLDWTPSNNTPSESTNETGFTAVAGGARGSYGDFGLSGLYGHWWSSTGFNDSLALGKRLDYNSGGVIGGNIAQNIGWIRREGFSVRCIQN